MHAGEVVAVVGNNAAGKSTVLRTILGEQPPISGKVQINSLLPNPDAILFRRLLSTVSDEDAFFSSLTVQEHLDMVASGHGVTNVGSSIEAELSFFELSDAADSLPRYLSSGQRRRLLLAAAFIRPFQLLVLDEPEQRLDTVMRRLLGARLGQLREADNCAALIATHDADVLLACANRCLVIAEGSVQEVSPQEGAEWITSHQ